MLDEAKMVEYSFVFNERENVETSDEVIAACLNFFFFWLGLNYDLQFNV